MKRHNISTLFDAKIHHTCVNIFNFNLVTKTLGSKTVMKS